MSAPFVRSEHVYDASHNLALDLYMPQPAPAARPPLIVFIHGGAYASCHPYILARIPPHAQSFSAAIYAHTFRVPLMCTMR